MSIMKIVGVVTGGACVAALIAGGVVWWRRRRDAQGGDTPETPARKRPWAEPEGEPAEETKPRGHILTRLELDGEHVDALDESFPSAWPPDDPTVNAMQAGDIIIFAVESEQTGNYTSLREELINAKVLSVEKTVVRARIVAPVEHAEHHGSHAGHGFRVGDLVEVPRSKILVAARRTGEKGEGYNSEGKPELTFKPSNLRKDEPYTVRPATPYDLVLPYRTKNLEWNLDRDLVKLIHIGQKGPLEQIMFTEDSLRGEVSLRVIDHDPEEGPIFVGRWDFSLQA